jgi:hypothetical protein
VRAVPTCHEVDDGGDQRRHRHPGRERQIGVSGVGVHRDPTQTRIRNRHALPPRFSPSAHRSAMTAQVFSVFHS